MYEENTLAGKLNRLYSDSRMTVEKFAQVGGVSRSAMQNYLDGTRTPGADTLIRICKHFSVSSDWLLGLSDTRSVDDDMKTAIQTLGLGEKALMKIVDPNGIGQLRKELSHLIEADAFYSFLKKYKHFLDLIEKLDTFEDSDYVENEDGKIVLSKNAGIHFFMNQLSLQLRSICDEDYFRQADIAAKNTREKKRNYYDEIIKEYEYWKK